MSDTTVFVDDEGVILECPSCGLEPEIQTYYRDKATGRRVGYLCTCKAVVIGGVVVQFM